MSSVPSLETLFLSTPIPMPCSLLGKHPCQSRWAGLVLRDVYFFLWYFSDRIKGSFHLGCKVGILRAWPPLLSLREAHMTEKQSFSAQACSSQLQDGLTMQSLPKAGFFRLESVLETTDNCMVVTLWSPKLVGCHGQYKMRYGIDLFSVIPS